MRWFDIRHWPGAIVYGLVAAVVMFEIFVLGKTFFPVVDDDYRAYFLEKTTTCLNRDIPGTYTLGDVVPFLPGNEKAVFAISVCGWSHPVGDGTHSVGRSSRLRMQFAGAPGDLTLALKLTSGTPQRVVVSANGSTIGEASLPGGDRVVDIALPVPNEPAGSRSSLDIELSYPDAFLTTPRTNDVHRRAIRLLEFALRPG